MLQEILQRIASGEDLYSVLKSYGWRTFEELVSYILESNNFKTKLHFRFKTNRRYEIDVLAEKNKKCLLVECKKWKGKTASPSKIEKAVETHQERIKEFRKKFNKNCEGIIVTLLDTPMEIKGMKIVPVERLNWFLVEYF